MLTADFGPALAELALLRARIANPQPVLALIGRMAVRRAEHEIQVGKQDPDGHAWAPWSEDTARARTKRGNAAQGLLWDKGTLLHSMREQVGINEVVVGTDEPYAAFLQDGTRRMPARAFLGWGAEAEAEAERTMIGYLEGLL